MVRRVSSQWIGAVVGLLVVAGAGCRRPSEPSGSAEGVAAPAPAASAELPDRPPADPSEEVVTIEPGRDESSGLELAFGLALSGSGELRDPVLSFGRGDRVCAVAKLPTAAAGDALLVRWYDALGAVRGEQTVTLSGEPPQGALCLDGSEALGLGSYSIELELEGSPVGDGSFTVADAREVLRRGGA